MKKRCIRCRSKKNLEEDHIIPKSCGGTNENSNKRILCRACHDYRHARDNIIQEINMQLRKLGSIHFNSAKFSMLIFRLGVLEAFNTPKKIRERGTYVKYWNFPQTHYNYWYPHMLLERKNQLEMMKHSKTLEHFINQSKRDR